VPCSRRHGSSEGRRLDPWRATTERSSHEYGPYTTAESGKAAGIRAPALFASLVLASSCVAHSAEAGWHLRQPPVARQKELRANHPRAFIHITGAPVSRWYRIGVFDTVHECAAERERLLAEIHDHVRLRRDESPLWKSFNAASLSAMEASECIASDDPRSLME
jgi:hypothetical protein